MNMNEVGMDRGGMEGCRYSIERVQMSKEEVQSRHKMDMERHEGIWGY